MTERQATLTAPQRARGSKRTSFWEDRTAELVEDLQWLLDNGESPFTAARRLGYAKPVSLARRLYRFGYNDLANRFSYRAYPKKRAAVS